MRNLLAAVLGVALLLFTGVAPAWAANQAATNDDQVGDEFRETISTHHEIWDESTYSDEFTRPTTGSSLHQYDNIIELNLKIDLGRSILERLHNPSAGD